MKTVEFPYELRPKQVDSAQMIRDMTTFPAKGIDTHVLVMRNIIWPNQCPCCRSNVGLANHQISVRAERKVKTDGSVWYFPLSWDVPYCTSCRVHVTAPLKVNIGAWIAWVVMLALGGAFFSEYFVAQGPYTFVQLAPILGILIVSGIICLWFLPRKLTQAIVARRMTPTCITDGECALSAISGNGKILFSFDDDDYADTFAALNGEYT